MEGLYTGATESSFKTVEDLKRDAFLRNDSPSPIMETPLPQDRDFGYWSDRFKKRQEQYTEIVERTDHATIRLPDTSIINFIGDIHAGSSEANYQRLEQEINVITQTPNSYVILLGDAIDGYFFNSAQMAEMEQVPEQIEYYHALLQHLSKHNKLLVGFGGDHCNWSEKMGRGANARFSRDTGAYYMNGVGYITLKIGDQEYRITGTHRPQGNSMYNNAHGAMRLGKDSEGSDIVVTAHQHSKAVTQQPTKEYGGGARLVTYVAVGAYKASDDYSRKMGFAPNSANTMFGASVILDKDHKSVLSYYDILQAHGEFVNARVGRL